ncbi:MAG: hypothetical protein ACYC6F_12785 [Longimicrobiales bacterium]
MTRRTAGWAAVFGVAVLAVGAERAGAQARVDISLLGADPVGELGQYVDAGGGLQFGGAIPLDGRRGHLRLRTDFGFIVYGYESRRVCLSAPVGCRIELDLNTTNGIFFGGVGPEVVLATGSVEPYLNASMGFSYFATTSSLQGTWDYEDFANTTNFDDFMWSWRAGGGMRVRVSGGRRPVFVDLGVEHHQNGLADFLTEGDIEDHPDGSITLYPNRAEANMTAFRVGVSIGFR